MGSPLVADLRTWTARRWAAATAATFAFALAVAVPTDLVDTPVFGRAIPPTWWAWPSLLVSSVLAGLLVATYVRPVLDDTAPARRGGYAGGLLTFFAVGCPVCNKLVLLALGSAGALTWFEPVQPLLQVVAVGLLAWALRVRLLGERTCRLTPTPERSLHA